MAEQTHSAKPDPIADILTPLSIPKQRKADLWEKIYAARNPAELTLALKRYPLPQAAQSAITAAWQAENPNAEILKKQAVAHSTEAESVQTKAANPNNLNPGRAARLYGAR